MLGIQAAVAKSNASNANANKENKPQPNVEPPTAAEAAPKPLPEEPMVPGKKLRPSQVRISQITHVPPKGGDAFHTLNYEGKSFVMQVSGLLSRGLTYYDNATKKYLQHSKTPAPADRKGFSLNIDLRKARFAHLPNATQESKNQKLIYDSVKLIEKRNFELSEAAFLAKQTPSVRKTLPSPLPWNSLYCSSSIVGDLEEYGYYQNENTGEWYERPLSLAVDIYFDERPTAMPNSPLTSNETRLRKVTFELDDKGNRVSNAPLTSAPGEWETDAVAGCRGEFVIRFGTSKATPQNKIKLSVSLLEAYCEPTTWGKGGGSGASDENSEESISF